MTEKQRQQLNEWIGVMKQVDRIIQNEGDFEAWHGLLRYVNSHPEAWDSFMVGARQLEALWKAYQERVDALDVTQRTAELAAKLGSSHDLDASCLFGNMFDVLHFGDSKPVTLAEWVDATIEQYLANIAANPFASYLLR